MVIPVYQIKVPEYHVRAKPNYGVIGAKIDVIVKKHFLGNKVAMRCLGSQEHKGKSVDDLVKIIKKIGSDRYDPHRKGDRYENIEGKHIDFFALDFKIKERGEYLRHFIEPFYYWPKQSRGTPVRVDIIIIYDLSKLKRVIHKYVGRTDTKRDGFVFRDHKNKSSAIKGIIKVL